VAVVSSHQSQGRALALPAGKVPVEQSVTVGDALDAFLADLEIAAPADTLRTYRSLLMPLRIHAALQLADFTRSHCQAMILARMKAQSTSTARTAFAALASFCNYVCDDRRWLYESPMRGMKPPKLGSKPAPRYLSADEVSRLWQAAQTSRRRPQDNMLIVLLLFDGLLRASELCHMRWTDVRGDTAVIYGKRGSVRVVPLSARTVALLTQRRDEFGGKGLIFEMSRRSLLDRIKLLGERAGIADMHTHLTRHTVASHHVLVGTDTITLQQIGGWASSAMIVETYAAGVVAQVAVERARTAALTDRLLGENLRRPLARSPKAE